MYIQTFNEVFGAGHAFCPAAIGEARRWLPPIPELLTGGQLPFVGNMPCFCHISAATDAGLRHLSEAGHNLPEQLEIYHEESSLIKLIKHYAQTGWKIVASHLPFPAEFEREQFWVAPELVSRINNKHYLGEWVQQTHLPDRIIVQANKIHLYEGLLPVVIKVVTHRTTGGGAGVIRCSDRHDLYAAENFFRDCEQVIIEQWMDFNEVWCLNYACFPDGTIKFLGAAQQVINQELEFTGNFFHSTKMYCPQMVELGDIVSRKIALSGYYGIVGLDIGQTEEGELYLFDINARMNASTTPLLALEKFSWLKEYPLQRTVRLRDKASLEKAIRLSEEALSMKRFLPLSTFDPATAGLDSTPFVAGLLAGESEADISSYLVQQLGQN